MPEAHRLNDFVLNGNGDPKQLLKGMYFWTWNTEEVLNMILWMREFNRSGKGRIEFTGFDMQTPTVAMDIVRTFVTAQDGSYYTTLEPIYQEVSRSAQRGQGGFGVATGTFPLKTAAGKHVKYVGYIKTDGITRGFAGLWWRMDGENGTKPLAFDNMQDRGATGTTPWTRYEISIDVPANATNVNFGILHTGDGTALANDPPSKTVYDPERDGVRGRSLGVHEHWNNGTDKKYSRNLGKARGIELFQV